MFIIAINTVKEFMRNKILYIILGLSMWIIFLSLLLSSLALSEWEKIIIDFSLWSMELFGLITTLFLWSYLIYNEIVKNTILLILSKNPSRKNFILWKFFWFAIIIALLYFVLTLAFIIVLFMHWINFEMIYIYAIILSYIKIIVVLWIILFFSTFISPFLTLLVTLSIYFISHTLPFVKFYAILVKKISFGSYFINWLYYLFPNFHDLSMKDFLLSPNLWAHSIYQIWWWIITNILYLIILLYLAIIIFNKREF